ncbi:OmpA/MotB family protein [Paraliomyxa miuraensis]|uniref:OmpA/MotB family protein n=1 Tax=Paraliomyxa miuraensis TaxID=376150 RepID=UPI0022574342|nr:OmpA family protein [Paraliomyxa miuraensis]MCX4247228.1 OmpA family protein [Paraliomyxa miuraensis]
MRTRALPVSIVRFGLALGLALGAAGCVTKTKHEALQRELDDTEAALRAEQEAERQAYEEQLVTRQERIVDLEQAITRAQADADAAQRQIASLQAMLAAKQNELAELEQRMAETERELAALIKKRADLKATLDQMSAALEEARQRQAAADRRVADFRDMLTRFAKLIDAGKLKVSIIDGRMVLTLPMDILFASGKAELTGEGRDSLLEVGAGLATIPGKEFQIEGHTDNVPIKTAKYPSNWELGAARALVVLRALAEGGVSAERLSAATYGELRPAASNETAQGKAANRRIEIVVVPDLSTLPGYDELNQLSRGKG